MILVLLTVFRFLKFCATALRRIRQVLRTCNCGLRPLKICAFGAVEDFRSEELRSEIYPQSGANGVSAEEDIEAMLIDVAVDADKSSAARIVAGRPQPPTAIAIVCFKCALSITVCRSLTLKRTVRTEVFVYFCDAQQEYLIRRAVTGACAVARILVRADRHAGDHSPFAFRERSVQERSVQPLAQ